MVTVSQSNRESLGYGGTGGLCHGCAADKFPATVLSYHINLDQNLWVVFFCTMLNLSHGELRML